MSSEAVEVKITSSWAPLSEPMFRTLWMAALIADTGLWTHDMAASWLMTSATTSPILISLMQGAANIPYLLFAFPAGVLADSFNHRTMLVTTALFISIVSLVMAILSNNIPIHPWMLLTYVFAVGSGNAFYDPVWKGVVPQLVKPEMQAAAFGLDGVAINLARAIGPAVAGLLISIYSPSMALAFNSLAFFILAIMLMRWTPAERKIKPLTVSGFRSSLRTGIQFARYSPPVLTILARTFLFLFPASIMWGLLPLIGRQEMGLGAGQYGLLIGCVGIGAILAVTFMSNLKKLLGIERTLLLGSFGFALNLFTLAYIRSYIPLCFTMAIAGAGWILILSSLQASILPVTPQWVRGRVIALYSLTFYGGVSTGSIVWGFLANEFGVTFALSAALGLLTLTALVGYKFPLPKASATSEVDDHATIVLNPNLEFKAEGPVIISLDYRITEKNRAAFLVKINQVSRIRKKNGGYQWTLLEDAQASNIFKEQFIVSSISEYQEQNSRMSVEDKNILHEVLCLTTENVQPSQRIFRLNELL